MEKAVIELLYNLYEDIYGEELSYDKVDKFYGYIGYDLESERLLKELGVNSTSKLQNLLLTATAEELVGKFTPRQLDAIARACHSSDGSFDKIVAWELTSMELNEFLHDTEPMDIINMIHNGTYNPKHEYFRFDDYGNLMTLREEDYYRDLDSREKDIIAVALSMRIIGEDGSF